ncbi:hypothetical protein MTO96_038468, partial [Rhipicephalus appendiculatus]
NQREAAVESTTDDDDEEDFSEESTDIPTRASRRPRPAKTKLFYQRSTNYTASPFNSTDQEYDTT